jgi:hypothetical protein
MDGPGGPELEHSDRIMGKVLHFTISIPAALVAQLSLYPP